nr:unnamed protein product [Ipomoea batatas]GME09247.1 unnamed protein product [Ipomoea batatas]
MGCGRYWDPPCYRAAYCYSCLAHCSPCWKENCKKWAAYSSGRRMCINNCSLLSLFCVNKN